MEKQHEIGSRVAGLFKSLFISYVLTAVVLLILSFIMYRTKMSVTGANAGILITYVISCLVGGFLFSGRVSGKRYLGGALMGAVYFVVVYLVSAVWNHSLTVQLPGMLTTFLICVFAGMLGGMLRSGAGGK